MPAAANLTITLTGPQGSGKSTLGLAIIETLRSRPNVIRIQPMAEAAFYRADRTPHDAVIGMMDNGALVVLETREAEDPAPRIPGIRVVNEIDATAMSSYLRAARTFHAGGEQVAGPAPADARITMTPHSIQDGDRVRFIIEGIVGDSLPGYNDGFTRNFIEKAAEKFGDRVTIELLERPEKPLAVGDEVVGPYGDEVGHIRHIAHDIAAVEFPGSFTTIALDDLGRAPNA